MNVTVEGFTARGRDGKPAPGVRAGFLMVNALISQPQLLPPTSAVPCRCYSSFLSPA